MIRKNAFLCFLACAALWPAVAQSTSPDSSGVSQSSSVSPGDSRDRIYYPGDTERAVPLGRKLIGNVLLDQKEIWTSPFRMHKSDALIWAGFGAATGALIATDHDTAHIFENGKTQVRWANHLSQIGASYTLIPVVAGFYGYGVLKDNPKARETGVLGAEALLDSLIVVTILKPIGGRARPDSRHEPGQFFDRGDSFPSGHAIETWSLAAVIAHEYAHQPLVPITAYGLATIVSGARFAARRHYASDILAGAAMGWFIGHYVYKTHVNHAIHHHGRLMRGFYAALPEVSIGGMAEYAPAGVGPAGLAPAVP